MPTTTRPLLYDLLTLRQHWLPPEPTDTTVTANRDAQTKIWAAVADATAELDHHVADQNQAVAALVDQAIDGADITNQRATSAGAAPSPPYATTSTCWSRPARRSATDSTPPSSPTPPTSPGRPSAGRWTPNGNER